MLDVEPPAGNLGWRVGWLVPKAKGPLVIVNPFSPPDYEPGYVAIPISFEPIAARPLTRLAPYWNGFRDGVAGVYELVKGDLEAPPSDAPSDSGSTS